MAAARVMNSRAQLDAQLGRDWWRGRERPTAFTHLFPEAEGKLAPK